MLNADQRLVGKGTRFARNASHHRNALKRVMCRQCEAIVREGGQSIHKYGDRFCKPLP